MKFVTLDGMGGRKPAKPKTSDSLAASAKQFLDKIDLRFEEMKKPTMHILKNLSDFRLPAKDEQIRIRTQTQLNLISLVLRIVHEHEKIGELTISTYTLNKEAFGILRKLLKSGKIGKLNLFIASSYSFREPDYFKEIKTICRQLSNEYSLTCMAAWSHFKITLAKCGNDYYQFEGSMNYSTNNMAEQILLCNNRGVYEHDYNFITKFHEQVNNKALEIIC